ncbi:hypothetical protein V2J09_022118 [Rumex salicifolius]
MESIVHAAIGEVCARGANGLPLSQLWQKLHHPLSVAGLPSPADDAVKRAFWSNLRAVPGIRFRLSDSISEFDGSDPKVQSLEECEQLDLKIVANEQLRDCFVGLYDDKASTSSISAPQRQVLERLAMARANGVTQNQLSKELGMPGNNFFYVVKSLESRGLVVRQSTIIRTKDTTSETSGKCSSLVNTNLIHLHRYATPLRSQQRLEITKQNRENTTGTVDGSTGEFVEHDQELVLVNDFLPAMKAVCDKLEQADGKVLVVADIKVDLGYRETAGHRRWRNICNRLQQAGLVEAFEAEVDDDVAVTKKKKRRKTPLSCLRLLKSFSPKFFEQKTVESGHDEIDSEQLSTVRRGESEQLVELPIEHQIFDMVDAEGSKGLPIFELCRRLGISNKKNHTRIAAMSSRFGLHQLPENHKKGTAYRCWTPRNFQPQQFDSLSKRPEDVSGGNENISLPKDSSSLEKSPETSPDIDCSVPHRDFPIPEFAARKDPEQRLTSGSQEVGGCDQVNTDGVIPDPKFSLSVMAESDGTIVETSECTLPNPMKIQSRQRYPSLTSSQREQRIHERLKDEKFILKCELQRWLENLEDRDTRIDRKTVTRCLVNLVKEGHCRIQTLAVPSQTNYGSLRPVDVILHSSVSSSVRDLSDEIHEKLRSFELHVRQSSYRTKAEQSVHTLTSIQRLQPSPNTDALNNKSEQHVGSVLPKMVRARLLHNFLWSYVNDPTGTNQCSLKEEGLFVLKNPHSTCKLFTLKDAVKASPLELFIQVLGSVHKHKDIRDRHKVGALLSDLSIDECKELMNSQAMGRFSQIIDILRRLKLIRMVADEHVVDETKAEHAVLTHALELKPYVEEPQFIDPLSEGSGSPDLRPHFRHDFILMTKEALKEYWQTLEYCYAAANPKAALHAFPGSTVHELFYARSWTRSKVMAAEHRSELIKSILKNEQYAKLTFKECKEIASDLSLSLAQVLRVYYDKWISSHNRNPVLGPHCRESLSAKDSNPSGLKKRKIHSVSMSSEVDRTIECDEDHHTDTAEENNVNGALGADRRSTSQNAIPSLKQTRTRKFFWDDEADKHLLIQYARQRATHGAQSLVGWASITDLPASTSSCKKRIAGLKKDLEFRKSLMELCNLLSQRYAQQPDRVQERMSCGIECNQVPDCQKDQWDNFDDEQVKRVFDEVLNCKRRLKNIAKGTVSIPKGTHGISSATPSEFEQNSTREEMSSYQMASHNRLSDKFVERWEERLNVAKEAFQSVAVANAIELFKLVFLSTSTSAEVPNLLAETLRSYSEHDLFSAFDYLRQKRIMVKSRGSHPYVLSQQFLQGLSLSQFPTNTGKRATKLAGWMRQREEDLMDGAVSLSEDLQCGDIFHIFALVSSGELIISPLLPPGKGCVGEPEDSRNLKRGLDDTEIDSINKKQKLIQDSETCSRREKGFPGIQVLVTRATMSIPDVVEVFKDDDMHSLLSSESDKFYTRLSQQIHSNLFHIDCMKDAPDFCSIATEAVASGESQWEVMANFAKQVLRFSDEEQQSWIPPSLFQSITVATRKAGDQGLSMLDVSELICMPAKSKAEDIVDVLHAFGMAFKVNGYDSFHVVDPVYLSKYFLNSKACRFEDTQTSAASVSSQRTKDCRNMTKDQEYDNSEVKPPEEGKNMNGVHKVTILNLSDNANKLSDALDEDDEIGQCSQSKLIPEVGGETEHIIASSGNLQPIVPWLNGDGTVNEIVFKGLRRRILGMVMQSPGILEENVISQMDVINPQSCKKLLELMVLDNHILVRKIHQKTCFGPPSLLRSLCGSDVESPKFVFREHLFANPMSTSLL